MGLCAHTEVALLALDGAEVVLSRGEETRRRFSALCPRYRLST
jgi:hypothetical protein